MIVVIFYNINKLYNHGIFNLNKVNVFNELFSSFFVNVDRNLSASDAASSRNEDGQT